MFCVYVLSLYFVKQNYEFSPVIQTSPHIKLMYAEDRGGFFKICDKQRLQQKKQMNYMGKFICTTSQSDN